MSFYSCARCYKRSFSSSAIRNNVRVRFAPSPTGFLHMGSIRTALYNFLFAKKHAGQFILRIEDTDQSRVVDGGIEGIERELNWTGLIPDEGPSAGGPAGPYIQSLRKHLYHEKANQLIETGHAYRCFCSQTRLDLIRKEAAKNREVPRYDNRCRHLTHQEISDKMSANEPFTIRLKLKSGPVTFTDLITGSETIDLSKVEADPILMKSDGFPTYHLANVVDDHLMGISHVLRGIEWQQSTPKHLMLFEALGLNPPAYGHLPLILNADGTKLSKRLDDIRLDNMRSQGYFPETIINYLSRMGQAIECPDEDRIYPVEQLAQMFSPDRLSSRSNRYDFLLIRAMNRNCIKQYIREDMAGIREKVKTVVRQKIDKQSLNLEDDRIDFVLNWCQDRIHFLTDLTDEFLFVWAAPRLDFDMRLFSKEMVSPDQVLQKVICHLEANDCDVADLKRFSEQIGVKYTTLMSLLRLCLTNKLVGPPISEILSLLGREKFIEYLKKALHHIQQEITEN